jgi:hypothetical protein
MSLEWSLCAPQADRLMTITSDHPKPRLLVVSFFSHEDPPTPRAERTQMVCAALQDAWQISVIAGPADSGSAPLATSRFATRRRAALGRIARSFLLDRYEPWSWRTVRRIGANVDAALLIGFPFSPVAVAARELAARRVPYIIDAGDPWVLTTDEPANRFIGLKRARRMEYMMWRGAAGGILTTAYQASAIKSLVANLDILVRPNGFVPVPPLRCGYDPRGDARTLRLVHFGLLSRARVALLPFLQALAASGIWHRIALDVYGTDWQGLLPDIPPNVTVTQYSRVPWHAAVQAAQGYDAALLIDNADPATMPSKLVSYQTLPCPRIALVCHDTANASIDYLHDKRAWLIVRSDDPGLADEVARHVNTSWQVHDLQPPPSEAWDKVAQEIAAFINRHLVPHGPPSCRSLTSVQD